jgi:Flavodoxin domain
VHVAIIYESLTGNTKRASGVLATGLEKAGHTATASPITRIDYQSLSDADLVVIGTWTDGLFVVGQRPGRAGRLRSLPALDGKRCVVFCTYALDAGKVLEKMAAIVASRGGDVVGGMTVRRDRVDAEVAELLESILTVDAGH